MNLRPMRGVKPTKPLTNFPYLVSAKVDGLRALVADGIVYSKTMKPIPSPLVQNWFGHLHGFDGELVIGEPHAQDGTDVFERSRGILMRKTTPETPTDLRFYVFDRWDLPGATFEDRVNSLEAWFAKNCVVGCHFLRSKLVLNLQELDEALGDALEKKYEGLMVRSITGPYKVGQSTEREGFLLKLKPFADSTAVVVGFGEQMENTNEAVKDELGYTKRSSAKAGKVGKGTLGYFVVKDLVTGVIFEIGNGKGVTAEFRQNVWNNKERYVGMCLDYSYQAIGTKDKPRLPQFLRWRDRMDISELENAHDR